MADEQDDEVIVHIDPALIDADPSLPAKLDDKIKVIEEKPVVKEKTGAAADDPLESLRGQLSTLQSRDEARERELTEARRVADEATQRERTARQEVSQAETKVVESQYDTVVTGISSAESEAEAAEAAYRAAFEAGNAADAAKAQRKLAESVSRLGRLQEAKADLETISKRTEKPAGEQRTEQTQQRQPSATDPVEQFLATRTDKTRQWLRDHPDHAKALALQAAGRATSDEIRKAAKLTAAHNDAVAEDLKPDTQEYFDHIETFVGLKKAEAKQPTQRRPSAPTTPVSHSGGGTSGGGVEVKLTRGEANAATDGSLVWNYSDPSGQNKFKKGDAIGVQEMARRKLAMTKEGRYDKSYVEQ